MRLMDVVSGPWAIVPEMLVEIQGIYATHLRGDKIDIAKVEAAIGRPLANSRQGAEVIDGVAVIQMQGAIAKRMNLMAEVSGGTSSQLAAKDITTALNDPAVKGIILNVDSPGGTVDGTAELADVIAACRGKKPVVAFSDGQICSAAYWVASAADAIYISGDTNPVGSIGVVSGHRDYSGAEAKAGIKTTEITAGRYKRIASQYEPLTDAGREEIQSKLDYLYSAFVDAVATNRGVSTETVLNDMADGKVFIGKQAIKAGLVDGVSTLDSLIAAMQNPAQREKIMKRKPAAAGAVASNPERNKPMTIEQLKAECPDVVEAIAAEAKAGMMNQADADAAVTAATEATTARICGLVSATMGAETGDKLTALVQSGISAEQATALNIKIDARANADLESRAAILAALQAAAPHGLNNAKQTDTAADERKTIAATIASGATKR